MKVIKQSNESLNEILDQGGYAQNISKQEVIPMLFGQKSRIELKQLIKLSQDKSLGRISHVAKYLGAKVNSDITSKDEFESRIRSIRQGWAMMGSYWVSKTPLSQKRCVFLGMVQPAALSAATVQLFSKRQKNAGNLI